MNENEEKRVGTAESQKKDPPNKDWISNKSAINTN